MSLLQRRMRSPIRLCCILGFTLLHLVGCGGSGQKLTLAPVTGKCFVQDKPAVNAQVIFHPVNRTAEWEGAFNPHGTVQADGGFQLSTYRPNDGAPPGEYKVQITWYHNEKSKSQDPESSSGATDRLGGRYSAEKTTLKAVVNADQPVLEPFDLK